MQVGNHVPELGYPSEVDKLGGKVGDHRWQTLTLTWKGKKVVGK